MEEKKEFISFREMAEHLNRLSAKQPKIKQPKEEVNTQRQLVK